MRYKFSPDFEKTLRFTVLWSTVPNLFTGYGLVIENFTFHPRILKVDQYAYFHDEFIVTADDHFISGRDQVLHGA